MDKLLTIFTKQHAISSSKVITLIAVWFLVALNFSFWHFIFSKITFSNVSEVTFVSSIFLLLFSIFYYAISVLFVPYVGKPLFILLFIISGATNYLMYQFGVFIDADMIRNTFETHPGEVMGLITPRSIAWLFVGGIIPAIFLLKVKVQFESFKKELLKRLTRCGILLICLLAMLPFVYKQYASFGRNNREVRKLVNPCNYIYSTIKYFKLEEQSKRPFTKLDLNAKHVANDKDEKRVFVVVLGETARAKNFSLNGYERETNPLLKQEDILFLKDVESAGTSTAISVPSIFSFATRNNFNPTDAKYTENLLDLLKQTGYNVLWEENDNGCKGVCSRVVNIEMDLSNKEYCDGVYCKDELLLEGLEDYIRNTEGNLFIVLHTIGSHGPTYYRRYPEKFKQFTPTCDTEEIQTCTKEQILNTYDNTILYTDYIVSSTINILKKFPFYEVGLMYVSDHGESLGENGVYLHGIPYSIAPKEQTTVPMLFWMNDSMKKTDGIDFNCVMQKTKGKSLSHDYISHTLLALMETESTVYDRNLDIFAECRNQKYSQK